ncbi:MAG: hypothetical protein ACXAEN_21875 [Candidatus Thorarchaeota archaeon]|jgi:DNA-binding CsgD family transcriptional regulator
MNLYQVQDSTGSPWYVVADDVQKAAAHFVKVFNKQPQGMSFVTEYVTVADPLDLLTFVNARRKEGEDWFKAAERIVLEYLVKQEHKTQKEMADLLGVTARVMNFKMRHHKLRIMDQREVKDESSRC